MSAQKDFKVCIVGGGVVGLVCAIGLGQAGVQVDVFEAAAAYSEVGVGIGIGPNAMRALAYMGVMDKIIARANHDGHVFRLFRFTDGSAPHGVVYEYPMEGDSHMGLGMLRATFLEALAAQVPADGSVRTHFGKRCESVSVADDGRATVRFADGSVHEADVLIGADGIKSAVREQVFGAAGNRLVDTGARAYRGVVPTQRLLDAGVPEELLRPHARCWLGTDKHIIAFPIAGGALVNIAAMTTDAAHKFVPAGARADWAAWVQPAPQAEFLAAFDDCGPAVRAMLGCLDAPDRWSIHGIYPPLESYVAEGKANVVLVGDAAHAMLPHLGAGAGAGIESAFVLARLLADPRTKRANLPAVLRAYEAVAVPRAAFIANASVRAGDVYEGHGPSGASNEGRRKDLDLQWEPVWTHDVMVDFEKAVEGLVGDSVFEGAD